MLRKFLALALVVKSPVPCRWPIGLSLFLVLLAPFPATAGQADARPEGAIRLQRIDGEIPWDALAGDPFTLSGARIEGDRLLCEVRYRGGGRHRFERSWWQGFMESVPAQAFVGLTHDQEVESGTELETAVVVLDLAPIKQACQRAYGRAADVQLRVLGFPRDPEIRILYRAEQAPSSDQPQGVTEPRPREAANPAFARKSGATVIVELGTPRQVPSMSGFLSSITATSPPDEMIRPLQPQLLRGFPAEFAVLEGLDHPTARYRLVKEFNTLYELNLGFLWGFPQTRWWGTRPRVKRFPPYQDFEAFRAFVTDIARKVKARGLTPKQIVLEVWNEPDGNGFWPNARGPDKDPASERRFFETFCVAERAIHKVLPDYPVAGPSWSGYDSSAIRRFLDFCLAEGCEVNALTWHEIMVRPYQSTSEIERHLRETRQKYFGNPTYAPLKLQEIHINEYSEAPEQYWPGETVAYLRALELGGADRASRSCWGELHGPRGMFGYEHCNKGSLNGLVVAPTLSRDGRVLDPGGQPRAVWWVYRAYAAGVKSRVESRASHPGLSVLASRNGLEDDDVQVMVGHVRIPLPGKPPRGEYNRLKLIPETQPAIPVALELRGLDRVPQLAHAKRLRARVHRIPQRGEAVLENPESFQELDADVLEGTARIVLMDISYQDAWILQVSAAEPAAQDP